MSGAHDLDEFTLDVVALDVVALGAVAPPTAAGVAEAATMGPDGSATTGHGSPPGVRGNPRRTRTWGEVMAADA